MRTHRNAKLRLLRAQPLFADCTRRQLKAVAAVADQIIVAPGKVLASQDADGGELVAIVRGSVAVRRGRVLVARLHEGDFFGEIALVTGRPRTATVTATSWVDALVIEGHAFRRLLEIAPSIRAKVDQAVAARTGGRASTSAFGSTSGHTTSA
ncbi:MAG: cyclic nucleotide-binding domain-containing protein [Marmoricola sp.]